MIDEIEKIIDKIDGSLLLIGFDELSSKIEKNKKIKVFAHLSNSEYSEEYKNKRGWFKKDKTISIKKMYKDLKKEKYDYIICDFNLIRKYLNKFIYNSYKICKKKNYIIIDNYDYEYTELLKRYKRYGAQISYKNKKDIYLLEIEVDNMKMNIIKRILYSFRDSFYNTLEFIAKAIIE